MFHANRVKNKAVQKHGLIVVFGRQWKAMRQNKISKNAGRLWGKPKTRNFKVRAVATVLGLFFYLVIYGNNVNVW